MVLMGQQVHTTSHSHLLGDSKYQTNVWIQTQMSQLDSTYIYLYLIHKMLNNNWSLGSQRVQRSGRPPAVGFSKKLYFLPLGQFRFCLHFHNHFHISFSSHLCFHWIWSTQQTWPDASLIDNYISQSLSNSNTT